jgi:putative nucleotidyltransferase with HDIG domain
MTDLEAIVKKTKNLPALPQVTTKLLEVFDDSKSQAKDVGRIIEGDQSLASQILKQVNSPFYGFSGRISSLKHAVVIMGFNAVKNLAIGFSIAKMSRNGTVSVLDMEKFWEHSLGVGVGARSIGKEIEYPCPEELLAAGLLHDIGKIILSDSFPDEYRKVLEAVEESAEEIYQSEKKVFATSHAEVGEWFTRENRFPPILRACVKHHHAPSEQSSNEYVEAIKAVYVADQLCRVEGIGWSDENNNRETIKDVCKDIGLTDEAREKVIENLRSEVDDAKEFFGIDKNK